jgi:maltose O-acetyltransferase
MSEVMSEKEKMLCGELYIFDKELFKDKMKAQELVFKYNGTNPSNITLRNELIKQLLGKIGSGCIIEQPFHCDYGKNIEIGDTFFSNFNTTILDTTKVTIGDDVKFGPNVGVYTACHPIDPELRRKQYEFSKPVVIESGVWIGGGVSVLPGVTIGTNSVIGAGSVVTKDIPKNVVAFGNPCRVIKKI